MEDDTEGDGMGSAMGVVDDPEFCSKYQHKNRRDVSRLFRSIPTRANEPPSHNIQQSSSMNNCLTGLNSGIIDPDGWLHKNSDDDIIPQESSDDETFVKEPFEPASTTEDSDMLSTQMEAMDLEPTQINTQSMADNPSPVDLFPHVDVVNGPTTFIKEYNGWPTSESLCSSMTRKSNESDEDEENSSLVMSEGYNIPISVSVDNPAASRLYERTFREIEDLAEEDLFVPGTIWSRVEDVIKNGFKPIILTGTSEALQKRICLKFLHKFSSQGYNNIGSLISTKELFTCLQDNKPGKVLVLENAFGKDSFNPTTFEELSPIFSEYEYENIEAMMLTSKVHCYNPCKIRVKDSLPGRDYFQYKLISLDMTENMLSSDEKMELLDKSLDIVKKTNLRLTQPRKINLSEEQKKVICNADNPIFLECCKHFETYTYNDLDLVAFFREPMPCLVTQFERLKEKCMESYAALFLCAIEGQFDYRSQLTTVQKEYWSKTGMKILEKSELLQKCKLFCDSFLAEDMKLQTVRYRHEMYRNAILCTLWKTDLKFLIENCPISFLTNILPLVIDNFFPKDIKFDKEKVTNVLPLLAQRFIKEIPNGNCALLASNKLWEKDIFRNHFEELCQKSNLFEAVFQAHELGTSFLAWSAWNNSSALVKWILNKMKKTKFKITDIYKRRIEDAIVISCVSGNEKSCQYLYEGIWHKVQSIEKCCVRSAASFHYVNTDPLCPNYQVVSEDKKVRYDTLWHTAAAYGHLDILKYFCSKKVNIIDLQDSYGCTSLHIACRLQKTETVRFLLEKRANVDVVNRVGDTAIHEACGLGNIEITKLLLTHKPKLLVNNNCQTVYQKAVSSMNLELLKLLVEEIDIHVDDQSNDHNPPHLIHKDNTQHSIKQRLESLKDIQGETLLHKACLKDNNDKILRYLVEKCPNLVQQENLKDTTALHRACESLEETVMTEYLIEHGADVNAQNCDLDTPLHFACRGSKVKQIKLLFSKDARYVSNSNNIYPHYLTANAEVKDCCKRLIPKLSGD